MTYIQILGQTRKFHARNKYSNLTPQCEHSRRFVWFQCEHTYYILVYLSLRRLVIISVQLSKMPRCLTGSCRSPNQMLARILLLSIDENIQHMISLGDLSSSGPIQTDIDRSSLQYKHSTKLSRNWSPLALFVISVIIFVGPASKLDDMHLFLTRV